MGVHSFRIELYFMCYSKSTRELVSLLIVHYILAAQSCVELVSKTLLLFCSLWNVARKCACVSLCNNQFVVLMCCSCGLNFLRLLALVECSLVISQDRKSVV